MASNAPNMESATQQTSNGTGGPESQMSMTPTDGSEPATQPSSKKRGGSESGGPKRRAKAGGACASSGSKGTTKTKPVKVAACADAMEAAETKRARRVKKKPTNESTERGGSQKSKRKKKAGEARPTASAQTSKTMAKKGALSRDALLELGPIQQLIEVGRKKGDVDRNDLRKAFADGNLGKADLNGVLALLREQAIPLARSQAARASPADGSLQDEIARDRRGGRDGRSGSCLPARDGTGLSPHARG